MDKREYLRSLGFQVGERGRFSAEMQTAIANADVTFTDTPKKQDLITLEKIRPTIPPLPVQRTARQLFGFTAEGYRVGFVVCRRCANHMMYCNCSQGVLAPSIVTACEDSLVSLGV
jgi:hypothetical protein